MKIFKYKRHEDYGVEHIFTFFRGEECSFLQFSLSWDDYRSWPYIQISSGNNSFLDVLFCAYRFSFSFELVGRNWTFYLDKTEQEQNFYD